MTGRCRHEKCFPDTACALGHPDRTQCECWEEDLDKQNAEFSQDTSSIPWNSYALGTSDLTILAGRGRPLVIGLIGPPESGKTTLLAYLYMWLRKHGKLNDWGFTGSWTLGAWETVVQNCRWTGEPPPSFPPHTSSSGRSPGLLHLALRNKAGYIRDVLFTDAPGEWFNEWAKAPDSKAAVGASWVLKHADYLMLFSDCSALENTETRPQSRRATRDLTERVGALASSIPLGFIWSKVDVAPPAGVLETLEKSRMQFIPQSNVHETSIMEPEQIVQVFSTVIDCANRSMTCNKLHEPRLAREPFLSFRGKYGDI